MRKLLIIILALTGILVLSGKSNILPVIADKSQAELNDVCWQHLDDYKHDATGVLAKEILDYQSLVEESLVFRAVSIKLAEKLKDEIDNDQPLSGAELDILNRGLVDHLDLRSKLFKVAELHECWIDLRRRDRSRFNLNKTNQLQGVMLSLSAGLMLYDNYLLAISIFEEDEKLRRILNTHDNGYRKGAAELAQVTLSYNSISNRKRMRTGMEYYEKHIKPVKPGVKAKTGMDYLQALITQSPSYKLVKEYSPFYVLSNKIKFMSSVSNDVLKGVSSEGVNIFSMVFGNTVGLIETRKGKLFGDLKLQNNIESNLKAGDILLEKTPFRLTDKFIPGHWGHAAIWLGTEAELRALGIWNHPIVKQYHAQIHEGRGVVEALRAGVEINPLSQFLNIDDLGVFRLRNRTDEEITRVIILALRQVGKEYDFNFDVETTDRIVCSELIYITYTDVRWPTDNTLGRHTISPDNIAEKVFRHGPLELVSLVHDGIMYSNNPYKKLSGLMGIELNTD
jgi:uncharacterized protein YycO